MGSCNKHLAVGVLQQDFSGRCLQAFCGVFEHIVCQVDVVQQIFGAGCRETSICRCVFYIKLHFEHMVGALQQTILSRG